MNEPTSFEIRLPVQRMRAGFFTSDRVSLEPRVGFSLTKPGDGDAEYSLAAALGLLYHFTADPASSRVFVRPFAGGLLLGGGGDSASQAAAGAAVGIKFPAGNRLGLRLEGGVEHDFESDEFAESTSLFLLMGFSFTTP